MLFAVSRLIDRIGRSLMYAGMGTLRLTDLRSGIERRWSEFLVDQADIASGLMPWETDLLLRFVRPDHRVLVIGCGTGRDVLALARMGCRVTGVEPSLDAVAIAKRVVAENGLVAPIVHGFFEDVTLDQTFDVVIFSWCCYSLIPVSQRRIDVLQKARSLARDGIVVVSCRTLTEVPTSRQIAVQNVVARVCGSDWMLEKGDVVTPFRWAADAFLYEHIFTADEFVAEASRAGLQVVFRNPEEWLFVLASRRG